MNVGDYVRDHIYGIGKIIKCYDNELEIVFKKSRIKTSVSSYFEFNLNKSSPQIIDLIEVGDFITYKQGNFYWNVFEQVSGRYNRENQMTDLIVDNKPLNTVEILTVITHEQMEAMQYRVEE